MVENSSHLSYSKSIWTKNLHFTDFDLEMIGGRKLTEMVKQVWTEDWMEGDKMKKSAGRKKGLLWIMVFLLTGDLSGCGSRKKDYPQGAGEEMRCQFVQNGSYGMQSGKN